MPPRTIHRPSVARVVRPYFARTTRAVDETPDALGRSTAAGALETLPVNPARLLPLSHFRPPSALAGPAAALPTAAPKGLGRSRRRGRVRSRVRYSLAHSSLHSHSRQLRCKTLRLTNHKLLISINVELSLLRAPVLRARGHKVSRMRAIEAE